MPNFFHESKPVSSRLDQFKKWVLQRPHEWWLVTSLLSGAVGLICFAVSIFNHQLKGWNLMLKFFISLVCIAPMGIAVLFVKKWPKGNKPWFRAHLVCCAIIVTYILTFFLDKEKEEGPDVWRLVSYFAFSLTSLSLGMQTKLGFLGEVVYFFLGILLIGLIKIRWWLVFPAALFSYIIIILYSFLDELKEERYRIPTTTTSSPAAMTPSAPVLVTKTSHLEDTSSIGFCTQMCPQQSTDTDNETVPLIVPQPVPVDFELKFTGLLSWLNEKDWELVQELERPLKNYVEGSIEQVPMALIEDPNFLKDRILPQQILEGLNELMMNCGHFGEYMKNLVVDKYSKSRRMFLKRCQEELQLKVTRPSHELNKENDKERIMKWTKLSNIALRVLFPNERMICDRVFGSSSDISLKCFKQVCLELARDLVFFVDQVAANTVQYQQSDYLPHLFHMFRTQNDLIIPSFELLFSDTQFSDSLWTEEKLRRAIKDYIFMGLEDLAHGDGSVLDFRHLPKIHSSTVQVMDRVKDAFIHGDSFEGLHQKYLEEYARNSSDKVLGYLKLDSENNVTAESMKKTLGWFQWGLRRIWDDLAYSLDEDSNIAEDIVNLVCSFIFPQYLNFIESHTKSFGYDLLNNFDREYKAPSDLISYSLHTFADLHDHYHNPSTP
ncbi:hypothetical protein PIB30_010065 [Stylosanthes scabra]|uniref:Exocyst subunit Exo70 family protein n=1 Tax=Stylosanthes scabra TaxID=79078 RepID=A0ABU6X466_9FABA|nr:hypothetical protein [Stylosanthes scabra]